jgi:ferrochelatase
MSKPRIEVLCLTYGEPASNDVASQSEYSLNILNRLTRRVAPIPKFVTPLLAARRGRIRAKSFTEMGYSSPLEPISEAQAAAIQRLLQEKDPTREYHCRMVMEFRPPFIDQHLEEIRRNPPDELVILPLYMAESDFTTGISRTDLDRYQRRTKGVHGLPAPLYVGGFGFDDRMGKCMAEFILRHAESAGWSAERCAKAALILGAHGTLQYPPVGINSGAKETLHFYGLIRKHLKHHFGTVRPAWLNHMLGGKWTFPSADECAEEVHEQGFRDVIYFPYGFMGDNNESQNEGKQALANFEWSEVLYLPCPNDDEAFCSLLADMTLEHLSRPAREDWNRIEEGGRRDLIQAVRPAVVAAPGFLKFTSPTLAALSLVFWAAIGTMLLTRGLLAVPLIEGPVSLAFAIAGALTIGGFKGTRIFGKVVRKNFGRLRSLPQPSPLKKIFSKAGYIAIAVMPLLGISLGLLLKGLGWYAGYAALLGGIGLAMWVGVVIGILHFRDSYPTRLLDPGFHRKGSDAPSPNSDLQPAPARGK